MGFLDSLRRLFGGGRSGGAPAGSAGGSTPPSARPDAITCHEALERVHEYLDGELDDVTEAEVRAHFEVCQMCYPHLRLETVCRDAIRRAGTHEKAPEELRRRVAELLAEVDRQG